MKTILFTTPRPFTGQSAVIQANAFQSWARLNPRLQVVVFADRSHEGDEAVSAAMEHDFRIAPVYHRSLRGVPLLSDLFPSMDCAGAVAADTACYVNADIVVQDDLQPALERVAAQFPQFLAVCGRWNVQVFDPLDFSPGWQERLWTKIEEQGSRMAECAIDLFAWRVSGGHTAKEVFGKIPDFAIGRYRWDNWLLGAANQNKIPVVDISPVVRLIHQTHAQVPWEDPDATENFKLPGTFCGLKDSTHSLTKAGIVPGWAGL